MADADVAALREDLDAAVRLLEQALFLRQNGERPPGAPRDDLRAETWAGWDRDAEVFLRGLRSPGAGGAGSGHRDRGLPPGIDLSARRYGTVSRPPAG